MRQKTIWGGIELVAWLFAGILLVGTIAGAWDDVLTVITLPIALIVTIMVIAFFIVAELYLRRRALTRETTDGPEVHSTLPRRIKWGIVGMLVMLWLPIIAQSFTTIEVDPAPALPPQSTGEIISNPTNQIFEPDIDSPASTPTQEVTNLTASPTSSNTPVPIVLLVQPELDPPYQGGRCVLAWEKIVGLNDYPAYLTMNANIDGTTEFAVRNQAKWEMDSQVAGKYKVEAYITSHSFTTWDCKDYERKPHIYYPKGNTSSAHYTVFTSLGSHTVVVNQAETSGGWAELGVFDFGLGSANFVRLQDGTNEEELTRVIVFDAMRFTKVND